MELIVHYGMPKTGTTSIQMTLHENRRPLMRGGVLYPGQSYNHSLLSALIQSPERVLPALRNRFGFDDERLRSEARRYWEEIRREIDRHKPDKVILSSELFIRYVTQEGQEIFRSMLETVTSDITKCMYVRAPAPFYLSAVQQMAKSSGVVLRPSPLRIRADIENVEAAFGSPMNLRAYAPGQLDGGDVLSDFLSVMARRPDALSDLRPARLNESMSPEGMAISVRNRRINYRGRDRIHFSAHARLLKQIAAIEATAGSQRAPRLKPEIADAVTRASLDLIWLNESRGVRFPGIDYGSIDGTMPEEISSLSEIEEICDVDVDRRDELLFKVVQMGLEAKQRSGALERLVKRPLRNMLGFSRPGP